MYVKKNAYIWPCVLFNLVPIRWLRLVWSIKLQVSFAKETYKKDYILQKRPIISSILLTEATAYPWDSTTYRCTHTHAQTHAYDPTDMPRQRDTLWMTLCQTLSQRVTHRVSDSERHSMSDSLWESHEAERHSVSDSSVSDSLWESLSQRDSQWVTLCERESKWLTVSDSLWERVKETHAERLESLCESQSVSLWLSLTESHSLWVSLWETRVSLWATTRVSLSVRDSESDSLCDWVSLWGTTRVSLSVSDSKSESLCERLESLCEWLREWLSLWVTPRVTLSVIESLCEGLREWVSLWVTLSVRDESGSLCSWLPVRETHSRHDS